MERQTLQQQTPVYHVCQECGGDGCRDCGFMGIVEGDFPDELFNRAIPSPSFSVGDDDPEVLCIYCGELGFHLDDCLYSQSEPHPYPSDRELDFDTDAGFAQ
ncbi:hypothetical protein [Aeromonas sp. QDB51]|uniref:hypothetical protein n=1 Tax=Aeromonas sp. QDB51 TaxID=2989827 RepID=UPI0022E30C4F|nr:hypothetical protein [Aeromonas sp. QDB51]